MSYQEQTTQNQTVAATVDEKLATHDLMDTIAADPSLSRFAVIAKEVGLEGVLRGPDLITVLAPSDDALASSKAGGHVSDWILRGAWTESDLRRSKSANSISGRALPISTDGDRVRVGGAAVVRGDVECTNGVLHVVDSVLSA